VKAVARGTEAAGREAAPKAVASSRMTGPESVNLKTDFPEFVGKGAQGEVFRSKDGDSVVKVFLQEGKFSAVTEAHVQELVRLNEKLREAGVETLPMEVVRTEDGRVGIKSPFAEGETLGEAMNGRLDDGDGGLTNEGWELQKKAFEMLKKIDDLTG